MTFLEILELIRLASTYVTGLIFPIALIVFQVRSANRKAFEQRIDKKIDNLEEKVGHGSNECLKDLRAMAVQIGEFQRDVGSNYPRRTEISEGLREIREDIRDFKRERWQRDPRG